MNRRGGAILSVIILGATLSLLAVAGARAFSDRVKASRYTRERERVIDLLERVRLATLGTDSCTAMVVSGGPPPFNIHGIGTHKRAAISLGAELVAEGMNGNISITNIRFNPIAALPQTYDSAGQLRDHHRVRLLIEGGAAIDDREYRFSKNFYFDVIMNGGQVVGCYRGQNSDKVACEAMAGVGKFSSPPKTCAMPVKGVTTGACPGGSCLCGFTGTNEVMCRSTLMGGPCIAL